MDSGDGQTFTVSVGGVMRTIIRCPGGATVEDSILQILGLHIDDTTCIEDYYKNQSMHTLGSSADIYLVSVVYDETLTGEWRTYFNRAIEIVNTAVPGICLQLKQQPTQGDRTIKVYSGSEAGDPDSAYTRRNVLIYGYSEIQLGSQWRGSYEHTTVHELLHALGIAHEQKRNDAEAQLAFDTTRMDSNDKFQYLPKEKYRGLTRFDPFSIMMYPESQEMRRIEGDPAWFAKGEPSTNIKLSELDKVGMNLMYPPCESTRYRPRISPVTGMYYCGRQVMNSHEGGDMRRSTDGRCGPNNWANCPACRVLKNDKVSQIIEKGKWQGWSGLFYCGKKYTSYGRCEIYGGITNGCCGPDNGPPCQDCGILLHPNYDAESMFENEGCIII